MAVEIDPSAARIGVRAVITGHRGQGLVAKDVLLDDGLVLLAIGQALLLADGGTVLAAAQLNQVIFDCLIGAEYSGGFQLGESGNGAAPAENNEKRRKRDETHGLLPSEPAPIMTPVGLRTG